MVQIDASAEFFILRAPHPEGEPPTIWWIRNAGHLFEFIHCNISDYHTCEVGILTKGTVAADLEHIAYWPMEEFLDKYLSGNEFWEKPPKLYFKLPGSKTKDEQVPKES